MILVMIFHYQVAFVLLVAMVTHQIKCDDDFASAKEVFGNEVEDEFNDAMGKRSPVSASFC